MRRSLVAVTPAGPWSWWHEGQNHPAFQLTVVARDVEDYQRFVLDRLAKLPGIGAYRSTLIMRVVKHTTVLPV
ncbi:MAG: Lrp/AsnC ligand binding domain-containing protein [Hyphomicrobium sp.]|nr:Lrp/AsnC ligand binding domain-containing protein [Hyphomicrobium sp.]